MSRAEELLTRLEAREAPLYHFITSYRGLSFILKRGITAHVSNDPVLQSVDMKGWGISLTRDPNLRSETSSVRPWGPVRLTFDQAKLNSKYKLKAHNYFGQPDAHAGAARDRTDRPTSDPERSWNTESEEFLITGEKGLKDPWPYVTAVDILKLPELSQDEKDYMDLEGTVAELKKKGITVNYVDSFDPAKRKKP